jgi:hypothetical protein
MIIKKVLLGIAAVLVILSIVIALQPADFRVTRTATISAPVSVVFAQVNDLHKWDVWSPWAKLDPAMKVAFEGAPAGVGASQTWSGNNEVGEGRSTITESQANERVRLKLEFVRPFAGTNDVEFTFRPEADRTVMTWSMFGKKNFLSKAMGLVMNCEEMCGKQFEQGLRTCAKWSSGERVTRGRHKNWKPLGPLIPPKVTKDLFDACPGIMSSLRESDSTRRYLPGTDLRLRRDERRLHDQPLSDYFITLLYRAVHYAARGAEQN